MQIKGHSDELAEELQLQLRKLKEAPKKKEREKKMKILVMNGPQPEFSGNPGEKNLRHAGLSVSAGSDRQKGKGDRG